MSVVIISGSCGLIGSEAARYFHGQGHDVVGIDNDMRAYFFGASASVAWNRDRLARELPRYRHHNQDIRDFEGVENLFKRFAGQVALVIHTAAQPSHDWAAREPITDFNINANGTLNLLEATRRHCPEAVFIFTSTNKVYGDTPNRLPLVELAERWEVQPGHPFALHGIDETMSIDTSMHSLFGAGKLAADVLVQEYGAATSACAPASSAAGASPGPAHSPSEMHGFLAYLVRFVAVRAAGLTRSYGYKGKQVRDNIHSRDLISAFQAFFQHPRPGEVYNMGGSRHASVSVLEAIRLIAQLSGQKLQYTLDDQPRLGDHIWYISDVGKFQSHYPDWAYSYTIETILSEMIEVAASREG